MLELGHTSGLRMLGGRRRNKDLFLQILHSHNPNIWDDRPILTDEPVAPAA
ncbi:MAG: hypothetical protein DDT20_00082 [Firmicutes bacterium]|nr:hypothetical protein [Bacillota bacterium]